MKPVAPLTPRHPIDVAAELKAPVLGLYGGEDAGIPNDTVERMQGALAAAGGSSEIVLYPGMPHAFHADYRPTYRREAAEDGWRRMLAWFRGRGVAYSGARGDRGHVKEQAGQIQQEAVAQLRRVIAERDLGVGFQPSFGLRGGGHVG